MPDPEPHRQTWAIDPPSGGLSKAVCLGCAETREFSNIPSKVDHPALSWTKGSSRRLTHPATMRTVAWDN